jgi:hypothetical protein
VSFGIAAPKLFLLTVLFSRIKVSCSTAVFVLPYKKGAWRNFAMGRFIPDETPKTQIALLVQRSMDEQALSLNDLAGKFGMTYEYTRRVARGDALPSRHALRIIAASLGWDAAEAEKLRVQDHFRLKHGPEGAIAQEFDPEVAPFERQWKLLDATQKALLLTQLRLFVLENRRRVRSGLAEIEDNSSSHAKVPSRST